jgi:hypothetical protein
MDQIVGRKVTPMRPILPAAFALVAGMTPGLGQSCNVDMAAVEAEIARWEQSYGDLLSDISCDAPTIPAHQIMCNAAETPDATLSRMGRLNDLAWVYAYENATKIEIDPVNPPMNDAFITARDACTDAACLCNLLIAHTNDSLGGISPYAQ